ncbi:MAG: bifunctional [glutamine synthetase] adenylyltransferase/[glutamine synthetase]-adenylyl-L-tyrosine phosphorylase, partial [Rhizobiales bacterium]|nr:bifunctional [glutamine synthetase] adenylyltransferase/[glutamine synthetase]-adenylyl-L-tyrosine phosphorylase [Hyphomicrobiales bacterium]
TVTYWLTEFADAALCSSVDYLLSAAEKSGKLTLTADETPGIGSGYFIFGMGKYGAHELNYSSDIDLIVFYDTLVCQCAEGVEPSVFFTRMTRQLVAIMQDMTGDGYVFRMDLRLRPDPRSTPLAISVGAAASYYESMGQNWERAALIKARPVAGDLACGEALIKELQPFIFRRHLDFAAIADVQSLKRQIHAHKGHGEIAVAGHNIKLGRGGIREIEFFVQTQQLIAGGRAPALRERRTVQMLDALNKAEWISAETAADLTDSYWFLRGIEHRLQMQDDAQTHTLPDDEVNLEAFARFAGYTSFESLSEALLAHMHRVQSYYAGLFEGAGELSASEGSLSFTGVADDPDTLQTLDLMGFRQPAEVSTIIRGWHHGRFPATRSERARELLTELMPHILQALSKSSDPDAAFVTFDSFLKGLPTGVQLFSLLKANRKLLDLLSLIMGTAPRLAETLAKRPRTLDAMLDPGFFEDLPDRAELESLVAEALAPAETLEDVLDWARAVGQEQMFRIGVRFISATANRSQVGKAYSDLADTLIGRLLEAVRAEAVEKYGEMPGGKFVVIAMGKLGGSEMTATSDLDLMTVYDGADGSALSSGPKQLGSAQYFGRMTQRLIAALSVPTAEGLLYEVDMRLRPSGNKGPISVSLDGFKTYHKGAAWTWERMALSRARVVAGDESLRVACEAEIERVLTQKPDPASLTADVLDMRQRMIDELYKGDAWDLKLKPGGLVDVEFTAQYLQLKHAWESPGILHQNAGEALLALQKHGLLSKSDQTELERAYELYQTLTQILRLCVTGTFDAAAPADDLHGLLVSAADEPDMAHLDAKLRDVAERVRAIFSRVIDPAHADVTKP